MSIYDLTGQEVSETYYRVVQVISGSLYDGLGNEIALNVSGTVDYNNILNVPNGIISSSNQLPNNLVSSSIQLSSDISGAFTDVSQSLSTDKLDKLGSNVYSSSIQLPSGIISSSTQLPSGLISSSVGILIGSNVYSSSNQLPNGIISSSTQLPNGLISSSAGFISSSNQISNEISGAFTSISASLASEKLNKVGSNVYSSSVQLPSGIISSSNQLPSGIISSSTQLPSGIISSSNGFISASSQIASDISGSIGNFSSSVATQINTINTKLTDSFGIVITGGNSVLTTGSKNISRMKNDGTLIAYQMDSYVIGSVTPLTGSIEIDVQRNGVTMGTASMSATASILNTTLTEWHTTLNKYDEMRYSVKSNSEIKNITLTLFYNIN